MVAIDTLPHELWHAVLLYAGPAAAVHFGMTCKAAHKVHRDDALWRQFLLDRLVSKGMQPSLAALLETEVKRYVHEDEQQQPSGVRQLYSRAVHGVINSHLAMIPRAERPVHENYTMSWGPEFGANYFHSQDDQDAHGGRAVHLRSILWWLAISATTRIHSTASTSTIAWRVRIDQQSHRMGDVDPLQIAVSIKSGQEGHPDVPVAKYSVPPVVAAHAGQPWFYIVAKNVPLQPNVDVSVVLSNTHNTSKSGIWLDSFFLLPSLVFDGAIEAVAAASPLAVVYAQPFRDSQALIPHQPTE